jgi:SAM-dependent methyltransferase
MKTFEFIYLCAEPFLPPLYRKVRGRLLKIAKSNPDDPDILDVGGRKSHYTVGVPAKITIIDLPRESEIQKDLNLGINRQIIESTRMRRTNVREMLLDDMTKSSLPSSKFDCVVAVEVLEHVEEDARFVSEVHRVLEPGGVFLMTTPNGDSVKNTNPDHKRHYTREQLYSLLQSYFEVVDVEYAIQGGRFRTVGLRGWSLAHPVRSVLSMAANVINSIQSSRGDLKHQPRGTRHLIATARKQS